MNLHRVQRNPQSLARVQCRRCRMLRKEGARTFYREIECYADLDAPFGTFYCQDCAEVLAPSQTDGTLIYGREF